MFLSQGDDDYKKNSPRMNKTGLKKSLRQQPMMPRTVFKHVIIRSHRILIISPPRETVVSTRPA